MIQFVTGIPGSGKGVVCIRNIVEDLLTTERYVVTNLPVRVPELNAYLQTRGFEDDIHERLRVIDSTETFEFYRYRRSDLILERFPDAVAKLDAAAGGKPRKMEKLDFIQECERICEPANQRGRRVQYHIDEAHKYFDAREWADTGRDLTFYASQHRHLEDNITLYSQDSEQVEGRVRKLAESRWEITNNYNRRFGPFRRKPGFVVKGYHRCPKTLAGQTPFDTIRFQLDKPMCDCYATTGALGMTGVEGKPEEARKKKGLPWWGVYVAFAALAAVAVAVVSTAPKVIAKGINGMISPSKEVLADKLDQPSLVSASGELMGSEKQREELLEPLRITGVFVLGKQAIVTLSDGRVLTERSPELGPIQMHSVQIAGVWMPY